MSGSGDIEGKDVIVGGREGNLELKLFPPFSSPTRTPGIHLPWMFLFTSTRGEWAGAS